MKFFSNVVRKKSIAFILSRHVPVSNVDTKARGDKDNFFDSHDNWTLAWAYEENSISRPYGTGVELDHPVLRLYRLNDDSSKIIAIIEY